MNTFLAFYSYYWSPWDLLAIPGLLLGLYAQMKLSSTYGRYSEVGSERGLTGAEAARRILDSAGLYSMPVYETPGHLTDHYDPTKKALFLSEHNYHGNSLAAVGVAAHEAGHALQHKDAYALLELRMSLVPVVNFASMGSYLAFGLGMLMMMFHWGSPATAKLVTSLGIGLFSLLTFFQLVTMPVEIDASARAKRQLVNLGLITREELPGVSAVLSAAALTYVAALVSSALELLRLVMITRQFESRDDR